MISRRDWLARALGAGAALALTPELLRALRQMPAPLIQRTIPSSGEQIPVIGLGRGSRPADPAALKEVIRTLVEGGGRLVDTVHGGPAAEQATGTAANELGVQGKVFWSVPLPPNLDAAAARAKIETSLATLRIPRIDLVQVLAVTDVPPAIFAMLREMKQEGRIRYIGVTDLLPPQTTNHPVAPRLEPIMRNEPIDFVGFDYSVGDRRAEQVLLPLAQERKIGVLAYFVFDRSRGLARVGKRPIDLIQVHNLADIGTQLPLLQQYKADGRIRYVGVTSTSKPAYPHLIEVMRNEEIDFIGVDYAVDNRDVEETILPLAQERKIGVLVYVPFGRTRLWSRIGDGPLPDWAAEFDAASWAQFMIKYVAAHPAVTCVTPATSKARNMADNLGGGRGRLPDADQRRRMAEFIDALPAAD